MSTSSTSMSPFASADLSSLGGEVTVQDEPEVSRTTKWRQLKKAGLTAPPGRLRRAYMCKVCKRPEVSEGHTRFHAWTQVLPVFPGQIPKDEWLALKREEAKGKKAPAKEAATTPEGSGYTCRYSLTVLHTLIVYCTYTCYFYCSLL